MSKLPVLKKMDFEQKRQSGSHIFFYHPDGRTTVVPRHDGKDISRGLLSEILKDINRTPDEFLKLLRKK